VAAVATGRFSEQKQEEINMANPNAPFGLRAVGLIGGKPVTASAGLYYIASGLASNIGMGSVVKKTGVGRKVDLAAAGDDAVVGVAVGFKYRDTTGAVQFVRNWVSGTVTFGSQDAEVLVVDDPDTVFEVQSDVTGVAEADIGQFFSMTVGAPNANGVAQTVATGVTGTVTTLKAIALSTKPRGGDVNAYGAYAVIQCLLAEHEYRAKLLAS
jgi:hypothetical protein